MAELAAAIDRDQHKDDTPVLLPANPFGWTLCLFTNSEHCLNEIEVCQFEMHEARHRVQKASSPQNENKRNTLHICIECIQYAAHCKAYYERRRIKTNIGRSAEAAVFLRNFLARNIPAEECF